MAMDSDADSMLMKASDEEEMFMEASMEQVCIPLPTWAYRAGARETIYMNPKEVKVAIVTCGGLCPGLNDVVQGIVNKCTDYGVQEGNILGIRYGFRGFYDKKTKPIVLTKPSVEGIHLEGGTILGTSRGGADIKRIVKQIDIWGIDMLFVVGGNGGNTGAAAIQAELARCKVPCAVVGVPKSIDNDILLIDKCFGYDTAVEEAQRALICAKVEASSAFRGVGIVKVMGRQSGFIAVNASMASGMVDIVRFIFSLFSVPLSLFSHPTNNSYSYCNANHSALSQKFRLSFMAKRGCWRIWKSCWQIEEMPSSAWQRGQGKTSLPLGSNAPTLQETLF